MFAPVTDLTTCSDSYNVAVTLYLFQFSIIQLLSITPPHYATNLFNRVSRSPLPPTLARGQGGRWGFQLTGALQKQKSKASMRRLTDTAYKKNYNSDQN